MLTNELLEFISAQREAGTSLSEIEQMLITEGGWEPGDVDEAFRSLGFTSAPTPAEEMPPTPIPAPPPAVEVESASPADVLPPSPAPFNPFPVVPPPESESPIVSPPPIEPPPEEQEFSPNIGVMMSQSEPPQPTVEEVSPGIGHEDFLGLFAEGETVPPLQPEIRSEDGEPKGVHVFESPLPSIEPAPESPLIQEGSVPSPPPTPPATSQTASEWSLNYMLQKAAAGKPLIVPKDEPAPPPSFGQDSLLGTREERKDSPPPPPEPLPPVTEEELSLPPQGLSPEQRIVAEEAVVRAGGKLDPEAWKEKDVKATSTAELWLARGGKPAPAMTSIAPSALLETAPPPPNVLSTEKVADASGHRNILRSLLITMTIIVVLGLSAWGAYYVISSRGPKAVDVLNQAVTRVLGGNAVSYAGEIHADLNFSGVEEMNNTTGTLRFALGGQGQLAESARGFGDGSHRFHLAGELRSGPLEWQTDLEGEVRIIDRSLYFHAITLPKSDQIDPDLLRTYWIKLNLAEIAQELGVGGGKNGEPYGDFGASDLEGTFATIFLRQMPLRIAKEIGQENLDGVDVYHYAIAVDPVAGTEFIRAFYKTTTGKDLNMTEDEKVRFTDALRKISGEVWIGTVDGLPKKITLSGDLDDEIFGMRVKGTFGFALAPKILPAPATVDMPTPILSLGELRLRMDEYKQTQSLRAEDEASVLGQTTIADALLAYKTKLGRYPDQLTQLIPQGFLSTSTLSRELSRYSYYAYTGSGTLDRAHRCSPKAKTCAFYHLAVNLHDITNPALSNDADRFGDISGDDALGCGREKALACYDLIPDSLPPR